jgi:hypothetical protein
MIADLVIESGHAVYGGRQPVPDLYLRTKSGYFSHLILKSYQTMHLVFYGKKVLVLR